VRLWRSHAGIADANSAKRLVCLSLVNVMYSTHCALKAQAGFRSVDIMGKLTVSKNPLCLYLNSNCTSVGNRTVPLMLSLVWTFLLQH
jgi:hypothetical protein